MKPTALSTMAFALGIASAGFAGDDKNPVELVPVPEPDFGLDLRVDGWVVQLDVGITETAMGLSKSVFIGFDDIISNIDWIVPLGADLRYKRLGFLPDLVALKMSGGGTTPGPFYDRASYNLKLGVLNLPAYIRLVEETNTTLDLIGGARYLWVDLDIGLSGGPLGSTLGSASAGSDLSLWDGIVGLRLHQKLNDKLFCSIYGDVGTGTSDLTWQILAGIGYQFSEKFSASLDYRYLDYDLSEAGVDANLTASGPQITLNWKF